MAGDETEAAAAGCFGLRGLELRSSRGDDGACGGDTPPVGTPPVGTSTMSSHGVGGVAHSSAGSPDASCSSSVW